MSRQALRRVFITLVLLLAVGVIGVFGWLRFTVPTPGHVLDEALFADRDASTFPAAAEDYFRDMDWAGSDAGPVPVRLTTEEAKGSNTWIVWTAGNDRMWDQLSVASFGALDLLKTLSSYDRALGDGKVDIGWGAARQVTRADGSTATESVLYNSRDNRWKYLGLVNEPCFEKSTGTDMKYRWGLRIDRRRTSQECGWPIRSRTRPRIPACGSARGARR